MTTHDRAASHHTGRQYMHGRSLDPAAEMKYYFGFKPVFATFIDVGANGVSNNNFYTIDPAAIDLGHSIKLVGPAASNQEGDAVTEADFNQTIALDGPIIAQETSGDHLGEWAITIPAAAQTTTGFWCLIIER